jgi:hypothetical protein
MASSPIINPPLFTLLEWYKIRDTFFGLNCVVRNTSLALEMAATSSHPDARWLTEACAGKDVRTEADAKRVFFSLGQQAPKKQPRKKERKRTTTRKTNLSRSPILGSDSDRKIVFLQQGACVACLRGVL